MTALTPWVAPVGADLVWFSGGDAVRFLNDIVSQEIADMEIGSVRRSLLLGARGKLDHILWALRGNELVGLMTDEGRGPDLAATLGRYRIRVDVIIEPEKRDLWLVMDGDVTPGGWLGDASGPLDADVSWRRSSRRLVAGTRPSLDTGTLEDYQHARVASGEPLWGVDVDERTIPQEMELVEMTVDFSKGCYLGQELVARIDSRGHVNRFLRVLDLEQPVEEGSTITLGDLEAGVLTSVAGAQGLGLVRREVSPGDRVIVGGAVPAVVRAVTQG